MTAAPAGPRPEQPDRRQRPDSARFPRPRRLRRALPDAPPDACEAFVAHLPAVARARAALPEPATVEAVCETFRAVADPTRLRIVFALSAGELCVCDLAAALGMSASAVSHQLRLLRGLRLVRRRRVGRNVFYTLDDGHVLRLLREAAAHARHG